ncbi:hypothetical protein J4440_00660 [Candidatus Woesearchaeota archaeon]|nr:hypothetical protein [Candidatus Woesearchaeota archaeon]
MDKQEIKKNKLDLQYQHESQKANTFLILITTGSLGFIGTFIWLKKNYFITGLIITAFLIFIGNIAYKFSLKRMKEILTEIENI